MGGDHLVIVMLVMSHTPLLLIMDLVLIQHIIILPQKDRQIFITLHTYCNNQVLLVLVVVAAEEVVVAKQDQDANKGEGEDLVDLIGCVVSAAETAGVEELGISTRMVG